MLNVISNMLRRVKTVSIIKRKPPILLYLENERGGLTRCKMLANSHKQVEDTLKDVYESPILTGVPKHYASH